MDTKKIETILKETMGLKVSSIGHGLLQNAISKRMYYLGIEVYLEYYNHLDTSIDEINKLIEEVTVNETWFFRDKEPFKAMVSFTKKWLQGKWHDKIRILSLPCATGEEPYSIAISLLDSGFNINSFQIDAVDINSRSLELAQEAVYGKNSFRGSEAQHYKDNYFNRSGSCYVLDKKFKECVKFFRGNLVNLSSLNHKSGYHIVFCRNLLIYLDSTAQRKAINTLDKLLAPHGMIFTGHAEIGVFTASQFVASPYPKTFSLVRETESLKKWGNTSITHEEIVAPDCLKMSNDVLESSPVENDDIFNVDDIITARLHFDKGELDEAIKHLQKNIEEKGVSSVALFWLGNVLESKGEVDEAIDCLRKSIYLDPENIESMEYLCTILSEVNDQQSFQIMKDRLERVKSRLAKQNPYGRS